MYIFLAESFIRILVKSGLLFISQSELRSSFEPLLSALEILQFGLRSCPGNSLQPSKYAVVPVVPFGNSQDSLFESLYAFYVGFTGRCRSYISSQLIPVPFSLVIPFLHFPGVAFGSHFWFVLLEFIYCHDLNLFFQFFNRNGKVYMCILYIPYIPTCLFYSLFSLRIGSLVGWASAFATTCGYLDSMLFLLLSNFYLTCI